MSRDVPTLIFVIGPPAVGKATVARAIAERTAFKVFTNHASIEAVLPLFDFGHDSFVRLVEGFRHAVFAETAASDLRGVIFTFVWAFDLPEEERTVEGYAAPFRARGARVLFLELQASLEERLRRNRMPERLAEKPSKRDLDQAERIMLEHVAKHRFSSDGHFDGREDHLLIQNTDLAPEEVARRAIESFGLAIG